ncbi:hypothetical protein VB264_24935 [Arcicella aquatica]|uniref:Uncharacterized protein n=1 Tax=Arcicella aquatica TaxID=217141 RepID=A0ABU5QVD4_9BACT|nr:hypothetical protein [Arcicella aquatica]MEA5261061.1 hypothetical protein [Arcicella aquatica]
METKKEEKRIFPEELNHLEESFKEAKARIEAIDLEIQNIRPDRGPQLTFPSPKL